MPLNFHKFATPAALAALAANEQGKFWPFHDMLFAAETLDQKAIDDTAVKLGLDLKRFNSDRNSKKVSQQVTQDLADADTAGVTGTPTVFINGRLLPKRDLETIQSLIDQELAKLAGQK